MDIERIRADFPILSRSINGRPLAYLDNAATTQKPESVLKAIDGFYRTSNANIHRGVHTLAEEATRIYEEAHEKTAAFIGARSWREIVFVRNTTEALNLAAHSVTAKYLQPGDEILLTRMDHHSNLIPWLLAAEIRGVKTVMAGVKPDGTLDLDDFRSKLGPKVKVAAFSHVSNVTGWISPVRELIRWTHEAGALAVVDGAQAAPHLKVDVGSLDADFYAFSGHKMLAPMGIGVLYGKQEHLHRMPPFLGGGDMLETISVKGNACSLCLKELPWKFEAGTANVEGAVGLVAAMDYLDAVGWDAIIAHERALTRMALESLGAMKHVRVYGPEDPGGRVGCVPFTVEGFSPNEVATAMDAEGIAIRSGFHCAQPLHQSLGLPSSARMSFYLYNTPDEVRRALDVLDRLR